MKRNLAWQPDPVQTSKRFTGCFKGSGSHSNLTAHGLPKSNYYFRIAKINDTANTRYLKLNVKNVWVKTKK